MDFTATNVYMGLTGFILMFDKKDSGDENDPNSKAFRLPSGSYDIPMILHDVLFDENGQLVLDAINTNGFLGLSLFSMRTGTKSEATLIFTRFGTVII